MKRKSMKHIYEMPFDTQLNVFNRLATEGYLEGPEKIDGIFISFGIENDKMFFQTSNSDKFTSVLDYFHWVRDAGKGSEGSIYFRELTTLINNVKQSKEIHQWIVDSGGEVSFDWLSENLSDDGITIRVKYNKTPYERLYVHQDVSPPNTLPMIGVKILSPQKRKVNINEECDGEFSTFSPGYLFKKEIARNPNKNDLVEFFKSCIKFNDDVEGIILPEYGCKMINTQLKSNPLNSKIFNKEN